MWLYGTEKQTNKPSRELLLKSHCCEVVHVSYQDHLEDYIKSLWQFAYFSEFTGKSD